jgi:ribonuclease HI
VKIEVYADGSATIATRPGGYGWVIVQDGVKVQEGSGRIENATNNDAELEAAIMGLGYVLKMVSASDYHSREFEVELVSDSQIILGWANGTNKFKQKKKMQKFEALSFLVKRLQAKTRWVKGHDGDEHNERCDKLAGWARKGTKETPKKNRRTCAVNFSVAINDAVLYDMVSKAYKHASDGTVPLGGNFWTTMFVDSLKEQMQDDSYFSIEVKK